MLTENANVDCINTVITYRMIIYGLFLSVNHLHWHLFYFPHTLYIQTVRLQQLPITATKVNLIFLKIAGTKRYQNKLTKGKNNGFKYENRINKTVHSKCNIGIIC